MLYSIFEVGIMGINSNHKMEHALGDLTARVGYTITQGNDLARSFGNLTTFQHKLLDYCFSAVKPDDKSDAQYTLQSREIIKALGMRASGASYKRIVQGFRGLNEGTALYLKVQRENGDWGIRMTSLFGYIDTYQSGRIEFSFNNYVAPYVFELKKNFYSFHLSELAKVRSKYTLTLMKLWNAIGYGNWKPEKGQLPDAVIEGSLEDFESWFIGTDENGKPKNWPAGRFRQHVLDVALKEIGRLYPSVNTDLTIHTQSKKVTGYTITIHPVPTNVPL